MPEHIVPQLNSYNEVLTYVGNNLIKQGCRSGSGPVGMCAYRGSNDLKCGVGFLINDSNYSPKLEGKALTDDSVNDAVKDSIGWMDNTLSALLDDIQSIHDNESPLEWPTLLSNLSECYKLSVRF